MKLSIITINYNNAIGLAKTIKSIVPHVGNDVEYIVIDGQSIDGSVDIIEQYSNKISYWCSEADKGIYSAMNKGIAQANGEYLLFVNSGDTIQEKTNFVQILHSLEHTDIVYYKLEIVDVANNQTYVKTYPKQLDFKYFLEDTLPHTASFIKKELLVKYGGYSEDMKITSDWAFFIDMVCLHTCSYKYIDDYFSTFYSDGISSQADNRQMLWNERNKHIETTYPLLDSLYKEWMNKKEELYKLKYSSSVRMLKKLSFLKWLKY